LYARYNRDTDTLVDWIRRMAELAAVPIEIAFVDRVTLEHEYSTWVGLDVSGEWLKSPRMMNGTTDHENFMRMITVRGKPWKGIA
jgi:hypothetical protein